MQIYIAVLASIWGGISLYGSDNLSTVNSHEKADLIKTVSLQKQQIKELEKTVGAQAVLIQDLNRSFSAVCTVNKKICKQRDEYSMETRRLLKVAETAQNAAQHWRDKYLNYQDRVEKVLNIFIILSVAYTVCDLYNEYVVKYT